jgi:hypothetical protein
MGCGESKQAQGKQCRLRSNIVAASGPGLLHAAGVLQLRQLIARECLHKHSIQTICCVESRVFVKACIDTDGDSNRLHARRGRLADYRLASRRLRRELRSNRRINKAHIKHFPGFPPRAANFPSPVVPLVLLPVAAIGLSPAEKSLAYVAPLQPVLMMGLDSKPCLSSALDMCYKATRAIVLLHAYGFAHMDLKPEHCLQSVCGRTAQWVDTELSQLIPARETLLESEECHRPLSDEHGIPRIGRSLLKLQPVRAVDDSCLARPWVRSATNRLYSLKRNTSFLSMRRGACLADSCSRCLAACQLQVGTPAFLPPETFNANPQKKQIATNHHSAVAFSGPCRHFQAAGKQTCLHPWEARDVWGLGVCLQQWLLPYSSIIRYMQPALLCLLVSILDPVQHWSTRPCAAAVLAVLAAAHLSAAAQKATALASPVQELEP